MKRKLLTQMMTEWRSNTWLVVELIIVIAVLHFLFSFFYSLFDVYSHDHGYNTDDIYIADIRNIEESSSEYVPYDSVHSYATDREILLGKIKNNPAVELATIATQNSTPYNYNYFGTGAYLLDGDSTTGYYSANVRAMTPDLIRIYRLQGLNGESPEELAQVIERGDIIMSEVNYDNVPNSLDPWKAVGKDVFFGNDSTNVHHVGALAWGLRRSDYEPMYGGVIYRPLSQNDFNYGAKLIVRVKPGMGRAFEESLTATDKTQGNIYLTRITSLNRQREKAHLEVNQTIRNFSICAAFLLLVIFFGFLGTFWFRTQQRVGEIAIRKVNGATNRNIFARFIGEGLILLAIAAVIATPIAIGIVKAEIHEKVGLELLDTGAYIAGGVLTLIVLAVFIVCGVWAPARKATKIDAAFALKDQ